MGTVIHLLGVPRVLRDGRAQQAPRGNRRGACWRTCC